jgi:Family of unknown function (DUF5682)
MNQPILLGIRHHGPGSAKAVAAALAQIKPDCLLIEGPCDAAEAVHLALHADLVPPVALLVHATDNPRRAHFYPFAEFSPEWQAIQYAMRERVPVEWMDLSVAQRLALEDVAEQKDKAIELEAQQTGPSPGDGLEKLGEAAHADQTDNGVAVGQFDEFEDPLDTLAQAAGYADGEAFWDEILETARLSHASQADDVSAELATFDAISDAMVAVRVQADGTLGHHASNAFALHKEALREAQMRQILRTAMAAGYQRIVVVCGAWHTPALKQVDKKGGAKEDAALLKAAFATAPKIKTSTAWAPWSFDRLSMRSGYGAGVVSPQWYQLLWDTQQAHVVGSSPGALASPSIHFITAAARLLRGADLDASSASVIEAVRLAQQLAALRGRGEPGLDELLQSVQCVLTQGQASPMKLIHDALVIGTRLGSLPENAPPTPLYADLLQTAKSLRLPISAEFKDYDLDLRKDNELARSHLLHRLLLLGVKWGDKRDVQGKVQGTFHELWRLQWQPEFAIDCVIAARMGATVADAAQTCAQERSVKAVNVADLVALLDEIVLADLPLAVGICIRQLDARAAASTDTLQLMQAFERLARIRRYGSVRHTDATVLDTLLASMATRISIGLVGACYSLDDTAARGMSASLRACHSAYTLLAMPDWTRSWLQALSQLAGGSASVFSGPPPSQVVHGLVAGLCSRLVYDSLVGSDSAVLAATQQRMALALSQANAAGHTAAWVEGFNSGNAAALLHDDALCQMLHAWLGSLQTEHFVAVLPLLRRSFSLFAVGERNALGDKALRHSHGTNAAVLGRDSGDSVNYFNHQAAAEVLPILALLFNQPAA